MLSQTYSKLLKSQILTQYNEKKQKPMEKIRKLFLTSENLSAHNMLTHCLYHLSLSLLFQTVMQQTFSETVTAPVSTQFFIAIPVSYCKFTFEKKKFLHSGVSCFHLGEYFSHGILSLDGEQQKDGELHSCKRIKGKPFVKILPHELQGLQPAPAEHTTPQPGTHDVSFKRWKNPIYMPGS